MVQLTQKKALRIFGLFALGDVDHGADIAEKFARRAKARRRSINSPPILTMTASQSVFQTESFVFRTGGNKRFTRFVPVFDMCRLELAETETTFRRLPCELVPRLAQERT